MALLLLCCFGAAVAQQDTARESTLTIPAYLEAIDHWSSELSQIKDHPQDLAELRREVPSEWKVAAKGQTIDVSTDWLREGLRTAGNTREKQAKAIEGLQTHLTAMRGEAEALLNAHAAADSSAPKKLQTILARPEFRHVDEGPNWLDKQIELLRHWILGELERLYNLFAGHERVQKSLRRIPWVLLALAAGVLFVWMVVRLAGRTPRRALGIEIERPVVLRSWQRTLEEAREAATRGDFREAIRLSYLAAILRLADLKFWKVDPTRTHREYLRLVKRDQTEHEPLAQLTRQFELAWYGEHPVTQTDFDAAIHELERLGCA
jgi:hypothetical protein